MQHQTKSTGDAQNVHCGPTSWADLPILSDVFDLLENPRDLAACASVCRTWRDEASVDSRWRKAWSSNVSDQGLWRWAKADGGYREQLRAKALVRKGEPIPD